jgi:hypothetical protein
LSLTLVTLLKQALLCAGRVVDNPFLQSSIQSQHYLTIEHGILIYASKWVSLNMKMNSNSSERRANNDCNVYWCRVDVVPFERRWRPSDCRL